MKLTCPACGGEVLAELSKGPWVTKTARIGSHQFEIWRNGRKGILHCPASGEPTNILGATKEVTA